MDNKLLLITVILKIAGQVIATNNSYVILAPKIFRPGMKANIKVLILKEDPPGTPVDVNATFLVNSIPLASATGQFRAGTPGSLQLSIPTQGFPRHNNVFWIKKELRLVGSGGLTFNTSQVFGVYFSTKGFSIYVQTDKGVYKPGQTVRMRILAVYPNLQVHKSKMTIEIIDPKNNKLALWKDAMTPSGVVSRDFELSSQPNLGTWRITVQIDGQKEEKTFSVGEYVLPKFEVDVLTNSYAAFGNGDIRGVVSAKYSYGKGVKGMAKVWVQFPCYRFPPDCNDSLPQREFKVDGNHSFTIPEEEVTHIYYEHYKNKFAYKYLNVVTINVSVTDDLTGKTYFGMTNVVLRRTDVELRFSQANPRSFKPNVPFQILLKAATPDHFPLFNQTVLVRVTEKSVDIRKQNRFSNLGVHYTDQNGFLALNLKTSDDIFSINIFVETFGMNGEKESNSLYLMRFKSPSRTFLQLTAEQYVVQAGEDILFNMSTTEAIATVNYVILSKGNIIDSGSVSYPTNVTSAALRISSGRHMTPSVNIVVYFVREDGEIIADSLKFTVNGVFKNMVSVQFSSAQTKPGEAVNVNVKASPFSQVGLLAVDKSVLFLSEGNDFSVSQVLQDLESYSTPPVFGVQGRPRGKRSFRYFPWYPSGTDVKQIFDNAGVLVLTDCLIFDRIHFTRLETLGSRPDARLSSSKSGNLAEPTIVRSFFPETWLWEDVQTNSSGHAQVQSASPDTITSWVLSGFAVSNETGFGVANERPQLRVFQPFFLYMDLPYSVIRGEEVAIKVVVFNYETEDMEVHVTLKASPDWKNVNRTAAPRDSSAHDVISVITVPANSGATVSFPIIPIKLGNIPVQITAQSTTSADAVRKTLLVEPEGIEQEYSYSLLLDIKSRFRQRFELSLPSSVVEGSARGTVSLIGDILGSSIGGIENLLKMPYGCGEQNMVNFAPSMFIRTYLEKVGQLTPSIKEKSLRFMKLGYQRELTYQHRDGSYSAFGDKYGKPKPGSLWLTAFVVKSFSGAQSYIYIDAKSLNKSAKFILSTQQKDGSFKEPGSVSSYLQGGLKANNPVALTAYVTVSLLEYGGKHKDVQDGIDNALKYLEANLNRTKDSYTLALTTYAMELADHPSKEIALGKLLANSVRRYADDTLHWTEDTKQPRTLDTPWFRPYYRPRSADIEMTSYALLVYAHRADRQNGLPIARWLAQQRNSLGGYSSTQDTVIGLQALSEFAPLVYSKDNEIFVKIEGEGFIRFFKADKDNMIVLQKSELPTVEGQLTVWARGKGIGMVQIGVTYNVKEPPKKDKSFNLVVKVITAEKNKVQAQSCVDYTGDGEHSGMAIMEFGLPSGFSLDRDDIEKLLSGNSSIKRIETPGRKSIFYFDKISKSDPLCVNITSIRTHAVGKSQPIPVVVYDYYKPEKRAVVMYSAVGGVELCDVCPDCIACGGDAVAGDKPCPNPSGCSTVPPTDKPHGAASAHGISLILVLIVELTLHFGF